MYDSWGEAWKQTNKFNGAVHKLFETREEVEKAFAEFWGLVEDDDVFFFEFQSFEEKGNDRNIGG